MSEALTSRPLLHSIPAAEREAILAKCHTRTFKKGAQLFRENEETRDLYMINYGLVRVTRYSEQGAKVSYIDMAAGGMFGEISAVDGLPRSASIITLEDTSVTVMRYPLFQELVDTYPTFTRIIMEQLCKVIRRLDDRVYEYTTLGVKNRIHSELLRLAREDGEAESDTRIRLEHPPTHEEIAARISTHREAVSREFRDLKKSGLIENQGRQLWVTNVNDLEVLVDNVSKH